MKHEIIKNSVIFFILIGSTSCDKQHENKDIGQFNVENYPSFQEKNSGLGNFLYNGETLLVETGIVDCGDFGIPGHHEVIRLFRNSENEIIGEFQIDSITCDNVKVFKNNLELNKDSIINMTMRLNNEHEKCVNLFIHRVLELRLNFKTTEEQNIIPIYFDSGTTIKIKNTNSSLNIIYRNNNLSNTWYGIMRQEIFGIHIKR